MTHFVLIAYIWCCDNNLLSIYHHQQQQHFKLRLYTYFFVFVVGDPTPTRLLK